MSSSPTPNPSDFASRAATYDELRPLDRDARDLLEEVVRQAGLAGCRVLDIGCGTGRHAAVLAERHRAHVWGVPHPDFFAGYWMAQLFPSYVEIERARFPGPAELASEFEAAGFASSRFAESWERRGYGRDLAVRRLGERFASTFDLLPDDEYQAGLARAEEVLPERIEYWSGWLIAMADVGDA